MRGILFGLLFSNLCYLGWGVVVERRQPEVAEEKPALPAGTSIALVSESASEALRYFSTQNPEPKSPSVLPSADSVADADLAELYCAEIGPFASLADAEGFVGTNAHRFAMTPEVRQLPDAPDYRVYLPPLASRELAESTLAALRDTFAINGLAIDSFLIARGELGNGIALGLFTEQGNALNVQSQLERLGYRVVIAEEEKFREEVWVLVSGVESEADFALHWAEIQLSRSYIQAGEKLCETIAHGV